MPMIICLMLNTRALLAALRANPPIAVTYLPDDSNDMRTSDFVVTVIRCRHLHLLKAINLFGMESASNSER